MNPSLLLLYLFLSPLYHPIFSLLSLLSSLSLLFLVLFHSLNFIQVGYTHSTHPQHCPSPLLLRPPLPQSLEQLPPSQTRLSHRYLSLSLLFSSRLLPSLTYVAGTLLSMSRTPVPFIIHAVSYAPSPPFPLLPQNSPPLLTLSSSLSIYLYFVKFFFVVDLPLQVL